MRDDSPTADRGRDHGWDPVDRCTVVDGGCPSRARCGCTTRSGFDGFIDFPQALNGASDLLQQVFGPEIGDHAWLAIGVAALPFNAPLEIEGEVELA